jgi:hypothetical protein
VTSTVEEPLAWAGEQLGLQQTRAPLARAATPIAAGADFYWEYGS